MNKRVKKYPIIGGPLDGQFANQADWYSAYSSVTYNQDAGQFERWKNEYTRFNAGDRGSPSSMVFLHHSLILVPIRADQHPPA